MRFISETLQTKIITSWSDTYICESRIWTAETESAWAITKIDSTWSSRFPENADWIPTYQFIFLPANATTYTYSYN